MATVRDAYQCPDHDDVYHWADRTKAQMAGREEMRPLIKVLQKFANHKPTCNCFICRTLTDEDKLLLELARKV